jgi:hypothetical protein
MTRTMTAFLTAVALVLASSVTVPAQGKKGSTPKPQVSSKGTTTKVSSPKTTTAGPKTTKAAPKTTSTGPKTTKAGPKTTTAKATHKPKTTSSPATKSARADAKTTTKTAKADTKATKRDQTSTATSTATSTTPSTTTTSGDAETPVVLTRVQERLQKNSKLADRLEGRLPKGADLMEAADGFKNLGQFVAAVNVSSNLGLDFEKIKTAMVDDGRSLGQAIQFVKTDVENPTLVAQRAESEAQTLIQQTEKTTTTTTTTSTTSQKPKAKDTPKRIRNGSGS